MKNLIYKYLIISAVPAALLASGCSDDFLDQDIPGTILEEEFFNSEQGPMQGTVAIYDVMSASYNTSWNSCMYLLKTLPSDESNAGGAGPGDQPPYQALDDFTFGPENEVVNANWRLTYNAIHNANKIINKVSADTELNKRLIAEAKALRAYNYLDLVSLWGDVPIVTRDILPEEWGDFPRMPKAEVYALIEKDLEESIPDLPIKNDYSAGDKFRIAKGAAQAILGKAYLYQEKWGEAATVLQEVIDDPSYDLAPSIAAVFAKEGEFGIESIFELSFGSGQAYTWGNFPWDWRPESNIFVQLMGPRGDGAYVPIPGDSLVDGWGVNTPTQKMWDAFVEAGEETSERKEATIMSEAELKALGGDFTNPELHDYEGFIRRKYGTYTTETGSAGDAPLNMGTNWRLIRYADVLLMAAEAYFRDGEPGLALDYVNEVRKRSNVPELLTLTFDDIVRERQLELAFEGFRYIDLVRWGLAEQELGSLGYVAGKHNLLPIPNVDVRSYGLEQNNY